MSRNYWGIAIAIAVSAFFTFSSDADARTFDKTSKARADKMGCLSCHEGSEQFTDGDMMEAIKAMAEDYNDPGGCVICHGGTPSATTKAAAHSGAPADLTEADGPHTFYPDPGSIFIGDRACGQCHQGYAERLMKSLMNTEAGKLQGNLWSWGVQEDRKAVWSNYSLKDSDGPEPAVGTDAYKK